MKFRYIYNPLFIFKSKQKSLKVLVTGIRVDLITNERSRHFHCSRRGKSRSAVSSICPCNFLGNRRNDTEEFPRTKCLNQRVTFELLNLQVVFFKFKFEGVDRANLRLLRTLLRRFLNGRPTSKDAEGLDRVLFSF